MNITSARFIKSILGTDELLADGKPQVAFIGRSNVGKSSLINSLTKQKDLAKTSTTPGSTQMLNLFLINNSIYLVDLPGYGYAKVSLKERERVFKLIDWYLFNSPYLQKKIFLIIDSQVGLTDKDTNMLFSLEEAGKEVVIIANKVDKLTQSEYHNNIRKIQDITGRKVIPCSTKTRSGVSDVIEEILS